MYLLTVAGIQEEFQKCRELAHTGDPDKILEAIRCLLPECLNGDESLMGRMTRVVQMREIDILLGRNMGDEIEFIIPKGIMDEEAEHELHRAGWDTGHWFRDINHGDELMVVVSSTGYNYYH